MTSIKFYVCRDATLDSRLLLACKLAQKAREHGMHVYIHTDTPTTTQKIDELLWSWSDVSFMPHALAPDSDVPILLGDEYEPMERCDYLINLSGARPDFFGRFKRMAEILDQDPDILSDGRDRYRFYQDRGYKLDYHKL